MSIVGIQNQVRRLLRDHGLIFEEQGVGQLHFWYDHTLILLRIEPFGEQDHVLKLVCFTNWDVPLTHDFLTMVAEQGFAIGGLTTSPGDDGYVVEYSYGMLADGMSSYEFGRILSIFVHTAVSLGDEIQGLFGGRLNLEPGALEIGR